MPATSVKTRRQPETIERFIGSEGRIVSRKQLAVNNNIQAEWLEVYLPEDAEADDTGKLYLYPIDNHKFCLQLCLLQLADDPAENATVVSLLFLPSFFDQYPAEALMANQPFRFDQATEQPFLICQQARILLAQMGANTTTLTPFTRSLQQSETAIQLLRRALECITIPFTTCQVPACRFLAHESEREKIKDARQILDNNVGRLTSIRELARKVAMNECYLKKGFKALIGKTIHEYQQELKITRAKELLQEKGCTVTEVAITLGYSSISHFSTAFKRFTGLKPCELLS